MMTEYSMTVKRKVNIAVIAMFPPLLPPVCMRCTLLINASMLRQPDTPHDDGCGMRILDALLT